MFCHEKRHILTEADFGRLVVVNTHLQSNSESCQFSSVQLLHVTLTLSFLKELKGEFICTNWQMSERSVSLMK